MASPPCGNQGASTSSRAGNSNARKSPSSIGRTRRVWRTTLPASSGPDTRVSSGSGSRSAKVVIPGPLLFGFKVPHRHNDGASVGHELSDSVAEPDVVAELGIGDAKVRFDPRQVQVLGDELAELVGGADRRGAR